MAEEHKSIFKVDINQSTAEELTDRTLRESAASFFLSHFLVSEIKTFFSVHPHAKQQYAKLDELYLAMAIQKINSFSFVGLQEMFDVHLHQLAAQISNSGFPVHVTDIPRCNVTGGATNDTEWMNKRDSSGKSLYDYEWAGLAFYNYCCSLWGL